MTFKPILFSTPMIQAILEGRKTQTRRIIFKNEPSLNHPYIVCTGLTDGKKIAHFKGKNSLTSAAGEKPKCIPGDVFWVREKFCPTGSEEYLHNETGLPFIYRADVKDEKKAQEGMNDFGWKWKPSIHMPKKACRIFLEVTDVRVERLQDISEDDAKAEGVNKNCPFDEDVYQCLTCTGLKCRAEGEYWDYSDLSGECFPTICAKDSFETLWESINGKKSWLENPWVWVYDFKMIEKPVEFLK